MTRDRVLAIDPGIRGCGVAVFRGGILKWAGYVKNTTERGDDADAIRHMARAVRLCADLESGEWFDLIVVEFPMVYQGSKAKGDPHDLLTLAAVDGAILGLVPAHAVKCYFPREWKGQLDKATCHARIRDRLSDDERAALHFPCASLAHNMLDAIGIGLKGIGRFEPHTAISRG